MATSATIIEPCRVCGGAARRAFSTRDYNRRVCDRRFAYARCSNCGTLSLAEVPEDLSPFYTAAYYALPRNRAELLACGSEAEREKLALVQRFAPGGRLLEIGPSAGRFLALAKDAGYAVQAIEMDEACCRFLESELEIEALHCADPAAALADAGPYDAIVLWHVIEHLRDPAGAIAACARALSPGGCLVISSPNPDSLELRVLGPRWAHLDAPRHLALLPARTLRRIGAEHGLRVALETTDGPAAIDHVRCGWCDSLTNQAGSPASFRARRMLGAGLVRLMWPIERASGSGPAVTLVLQRD